MNTVSLPRSQGQLIRLARGERTQKQFAQDLGVDRTCLSRYESERLGAPTAVLNHCLSAVATLAENTGLVASPVQRALAHARFMVAELEIAEANVPGQPATQRRRRV